MESLLKFLSESSALQWLMPLVIAAMFIDFFFKIKKSLVETSRRTHSADLMTKLLQMLQDHSDARIENTELSVRIRQHLEAEIEWVLAQSSKSRVPVSHPEPLTAVIASSTGEASLITPPSIGALDFLSMVIVRAMSVLWIAVNFLFLYFTIFPSHPGSSSTTFGTKIILFLVILCMQIAGVWIWSLSNDIRDSQPFGRISKWLRRQFMMRRTK